MENHAVVVGSGFAGLTAARVLSDFYQKVTVIEQDDVADPYVFRNGTPQAPQMHTLMSGGHIMLFRLFPTLEQALLANGSHKVDALNDLYLYWQTGWKPQAKSDLRMYLQTRALLEGTIRTLLKDYQNVNFMYGTEATGLLADFQKGILTGITIKDLHTQKESNVYGSLIVDASGARTHFPEWIEQLGFSKPKVTKERIDYYQFSRMWRFNKNFKHHWEYLVARRGDLKNGAYAMHVEDDAGGERWLVGLVGHAPPPKELNDQTYLDYAKALPVPNFYEAVKDAEPLTPLKLFVLPDARRFDYGTGTPGGFVALGDALGVFPPHAGYGMTFAIASAEMLQKILQSGITEVTPTFFRNVKNTIDEFWYKSVTRDVKKQSKNRMTAWYLNSLNALSDHDSDVWDALFGVVLFARPYRSLFKPALIFKVLKYHLTNLF